MRILDLVHDTNLVELDVEVLVDTLEGTADLNVVLELNGHLVVDERLEEAVFPMCQPFSPNKSCVFLVPFHIPLCPNQTFEKAGFRFTGWVFFLPSAFKLACFWVPEG